MKTKLSVLFQEEIEAKMIEELEAEMLELCKKYSSKKITLDSNKRNIFSIELRAKIIECLSDNEREMRIDWSTGELLDDVMFDYEARLDDADDKTLFDALSEQAYTYELDDDAEIVELYKEVKADIEARRTLLNENI